MKNNQKIFIYLNQKIVSLNGTVVDTPVISIDLLKEKLSIWVDEKGISEEEIVGRQVAGDRIIEVFVQRNTELRLNLNSLNLSSLPKEVLHYLKDLRALNLQDNKLTVIDPAIFNHLPALTYLDLGCNQLTGIDLTTFKDLPALVCLFLTGARITEIDPATFNHLRLLRVLDLSYNKLTGIDPATFNHLPELTDLNLSDNQLTGIDPATFNSLPALTDLDLSWNQLTGIDPATFNHLTALTRLRLMHNELTTLNPQVLFGSQSVQCAIDLDFNRLNVTTAEAITAFNHNQGAHPHIAFSIYDAHSIGDSTITKETLYQMVRHWKDIAPKKPISPLWERLTEQAPRQWEAFTTFLTRLYNECPRYNREIDSTLKENIRKLLIQMEESLKKGPDSLFIKKCLNVAEMSTGTCIDRVKVGYILLQLESVLLESQSKDRKKEIQDVIILANKIIDFVGNVADALILFDIGSRKFVTFTIPPQDESSGQTVEEHRQIHLVAKSVEGFQHIPIGPHSSSKCNVGLVRG